MNLNNSSLKIYLIQLNVKGCFVQFVACRFFSSLNSVYSSRLRKFHSLRTNIGLLLINQMLINQLLLSSYVKQVIRANYFLHLKYSEIIVGPLLIETLFQPSSTSLCHLVHPIQVMKNTLITNGLLFVNV